MTHVVTDNCIRCKYMDCVDVCPVDCFHEGENMLVINPVECIDCGVCVSQCPAKAIEPDISLGMEKWLQINAKYSCCWPKVKINKGALPEAEKFDGVPNKFERYFSCKPGKGDG